MHKLGHMHEMKYYTAAKNNEALIHAITCLILKNCLLGDRRQATKDSTLHGPII